MPSSVETDGLHPPRELLLCHKEIKAKVGLARVGLARLESSRCIQDYSKRR